MSFWLWICGCVGRSRSSCWHHHSHDDPESIERFRREAVSAAALNHPNLVAIYDHGSDGQHPFIVMEYVNGETLKSIVAREGGCRRLVCGRTAWSYRRRLKRPTPQESFTAT